MPTFAKRAIRLHVDSLLIVEVRATIDEGVVGMDELDLRDWVDAGCPERSEWESRKKS